ncbi:UNVERIFIED_CONTAM: hypothetical protein Sradi_4927600 [Sesamum radiatum]|uniref:Uncharacterized protein n=1 Tax=Sesamum radiatum TaxID=300843 RepID=A0AAW2MEX0_SESRA
MSGKVLLCAFGLHQRVNSYDPTSWLLVGSCVTVADILSELSTVFPEREGGHADALVDCETHDCEISNHVYRVAENQEVIKASEAFWCARCHLVLRVVDEGSPSP